MTKRVLLRGGSWYGLNPWYCRSAFRWYDDPGNVYNDVGFRVCCTTTKSGETK